MNACIEQAGIKHVITSRKFMDKMNFTAQCGDRLSRRLARTSRPPPTRQSATSQSYFLPAGMLGTQLGLQRVKADDVLTVIFTSGSTGTPKGVMLTYANIASNVAAIDQVVHLRDTDVLDRHPAVFSLASATR